MDIEVRHLADRVGRQPAARGNLHDAQSRRIVRFVQSVPADIQVMICSGGRPIPGAHKNGIVQLLYIEDQGTGLSLFTLIQFVVYEKIAVVFRQPSLVRVDEDSGIRTHRVLQAKPGPSHP